MALHFDFTGMTDEAREEYTWTDMEKGEMHPVTNTIIWSTLSVGMGRVSKTNISEFFARLAVVYKMDKVGGIIEFKEGERVERMITEDELIAHIGLTTNVSGETRAAWARRMFVNKQTSVPDQIKWQFEREQTDKINSVEVPA